MTTNILIVTFWSLREAHIQANVLPSIRTLRKFLPTGSKIILVTLEKRDLKLIDSAYKLSMDQLASENILWKPFPYLPFGIGLMGIGVWMVLRLAFLSWAQKIKVIHCWCTPAGAIGYALSLLTGKRLLIDSYEPHAEAMVENGTWSRSSFAFRFLFWLEKLQSQRAWRVIGVTEGMHTYAIQKFNIDLSDRYYVKPSCVDLSLFTADKLKNRDLLEKFQLHDKVVCVLAGQLGGIYLTEEVFDFFKVAADYWGDKFRVLLLMRLGEEELESCCKRAGLDAAVVRLTFVSHEEVPMYIGLGDFGLTPVKPVPTKLYCTPLKDGEYWALGLPVVIPAGISDDSQIIEDNKIGAVLRNLNKEDYRQAVITIDRLLQKPRMENFRKIRAIAHRYRGQEIGRKVYKEVYTDVSVFLPGS